jgi:hypothetical protein
VYSCSKKKNQDRFRPVGSDHSLVSSSTCSSLKMSALAFRPNKLRHTEVALDDSIVGLQLFLALAKVSECVPTFRPYLSNSTRFLDARIGFSFSHSLRISSFILYSQTYNLSFPYTIPLSSFASRNLCSGTYAKPLFAPQHSIVCMDRSAGIRLHPRALALCIAAPLLSRSGSLFVSF